MRARSGSRSPRGKPTAPLAAPSPCSRVPGSPPGSPLPTGRHDHAGGDGDQDDPRGHGPCPPAHGRVTPSRAEERAHWRIAALRVLMPPLDAADGMRLVSTSGAPGAGSGKSVTPWSRMHRANSRAAFCCSLLRVWPVKPDGSRSLHAAMAAFHAALSVSSEPRGRRPRPGDREEHRPSARRRPRGQAPGGRRALRDGATPSRAGPHHQLTTRGSRGAPADGGARTPEPGARRGTRHPMLMGHVALRGIGNVMRCRCSGCPVAGLREDAPRVIAQNVRHASRPSTDGRRRLL